MCISSHIGPLLEVLVKYSDLGLLDMNWFSERGKAEFIMLNIPNLKISIANIP